MLPCGMESTGKKVLVTGATGLVGSRTAARFASLGVGVRALVRKQSDHPSLAAANIEQVEGDFTEPSTMAAAARGAEWLIHCAATVGADLEDARRVNVGGTESAALAARNAGCRRMVHISTCSVYARGPNDDVDENSPLKTSGDNYSVTKADADRALEPFIREGQEITILRPTAILGVHPSSSWAVKVPARIRDGKFPLRIDGSDSLGVVHVENLVDAILLALDQRGAAGRAFNVVDETITWNAYAEEVRGWFPGSPPLAFIPEAEVAPGAFWKGKFSNARIRAELGYVARLTYADGMAEAAVWWRGQA